MSSINGWYGPCSAKDLIEVIPEVWEKGHNSIYVPSSK